jgi:LmbE family N-acetylglucosaminyl deacetylase
MISCLADPILVIAPHPDDETIGCGGTILRAHAEGKRVHWLIVTCMDANDGWPREKIERRKLEIDAAARLLGITQTHLLKFPTGRLETVPMGELISAIKHIVTKVQPSTLLLPNRSDAHTDHRVVFDAGAACAKWFRHPSVRSVLAYETISETDQGIGPDAAFSPQIFVDISTTLEAKLSACAIYADELGAFPFPRSEAAIRALALVRGAASGFMAAEAFSLIRLRG